MLNNVDAEPCLTWYSYFPGGGIAMARVLYDGLVEYEDGTPANSSQMAKDVVNFLAWTSEPEHDQRKKMGMQVSRPTATSAGSRNRPVADSTL